MNNISVFLLLFSFIVTILHSHGFYIDKRVPQDDYEPRKRNSCNGRKDCMRKRSNFPVLPDIMEQEAPELENLGTLLDLSAEPAVEDLSRQIMSEAKLWEAIQEAHKEIMRQKQGGSDTEEMPPANPLAGSTSGVGVANGKCALPSCIAI